MPMSRNWVEKEICNLADNDRDIARLVLVLAKAAYQADEKMYEKVLSIIGRLAINRCAFNIILFEKYKAFTKIYFF